MSWDIYGAHKAAVVENDTRCSPHQKHQTKHHRKPTVYPFPLFHSRQNWPRQKISVTNPSRHNVCRIVRMTRCYAVNHSANRAAALETLHQKYISTMNTADFESHRHKLNIKPHLPDFANYHLSINKGTTTTVVHNLICI